MHLHAILHIVTMRCCYFFVKTLHEMRFSHFLRHLLGKNIIITLVCTALNINKQSGHNHNKTNNMKHMTVSISHDDDRL